MKGYKMISIIILLIITISFDILTGKQLHTEVTNDSAYVLTEAVCTQNKLIIGSLEDEFYIIFQADYDYTVGTTVYSFNKYQFLRKTIKLGDTKQIRYNINNPKERFEEIETLIIKLIIGIIIAIMIGFFFIRVLSIK